jgi:hypothetical protein
VNRRATLKLLTAAALWPPEAFARDAKAKGSEPSTTVTPRVILESRRPQGGRVVWRHSDTGFASSVDPIVLSPDACWFVSALVSGDVGRNGDWLEIIGARTESLDAVAKVRIIRRLFSPMLGAPTDPSASHLTDPGRNPLRWIDSQSIALLWTDDAQVRQVFRVHIPTGQMDQLTFSASHVEYFECHGADVLIYAARLIPSDDTARRRQSEGFVVDSLDGYSLAQGWIDAAGGLGRAWDCQWFLRRSRSSAVALDINGLGRDLCGVNNSLLARFSPDGETVLLTDTAAQVPERWDRYTKGIVGVALRDYRANGSLGLYARLLKQCFILDVESGESVPVIDAPLIALPPNGIAWSPSGSSFLLGPVLLPAGGQPGEEALLEVDRKTRSWVRIPVSDGLKTALTPGQDGYAVLRWRAEDEVEVGDGTSTLRYKKAEGAWVQTGQTRPRPADDEAPISIQVRQGLNDAPVYVARLGADGREHVILDPNPTLKTVKLARVESIDWSDSRGNPWSGLIYHPLRTADTRRGALVIQSYVRANPGEFSLTGLGGSFPALGPGWSIFAAQALAARGMMVLQTGITRNYQPETEATTFVDGIESAVHKLDAMGLIDPARIGLSGWSRSGWHVECALCHSDIVFASAIASDNVDGSYMQNTLLPGDFLRENGARPSGKGLQQWLERSPAFNAERIYTPLRLQSESQSGPNLLAAWELFERLRELDRPVEYYVIPDVEHGCHTLQNPRQILANQEGAVDWHDFWLNGRSDPTVQKSEQYARWKILREKRDRTMQNVRPSALRWTVA